MTSKATLKILAEQGVTPKDISQIERARKLVDGVNARLAAAGAPICYCVVIVTAESARNRPPASEFGES